MEAEKLSWCPSWSNSLWQGWSSGLVHWPGGNATDLIWRMLASSDGISSWTPLKTQHSNPNPLANQLWCIDFLTPPTPLIITHSLPAFLESLMPLKNWCSIHANGRKAFWSILYVSVVFFPSLKQNFIAYRSSKTSSRADCIFEIRQLWQSGFSRVYSNSCCMCSFEPEIIKIGQSSHKMYCNNIVNFRESTTILNASTKKYGNLLKAPRIHKCTKILMKLALVLISSVFPQMLFELFVKSSCSIYCKKTFDCFHSSFFLSSSPSSPSYGRWSIFLEVPIFTFLSATFIFGDLPPVFT